MGLFGRRGERRDGGSGDRPAGGTRLGPSGPLLRFLGEARRAREEGEEAPRALIVGPPSGRTIESLAGAGFRVSVDGETEPRPPLDHPAGTFDLVLAFDLPDRLEDEPWRALLGELVRVLRPGGAAWFLAGCRDPVPGLPRRWDLEPDGSLSIHELQGPTRPCQPRSNRDLERLAAGVASIEITVRRDGYREIVARRPPSPRS